MSLEESLLGLSADPCPFSLLASACWGLSETLLEFFVERQDLASALAYVAKKAPLEGPRYFISPVAFKANMPMSAASPAGVEEACSCAWVLGDIILGLGVGLSIKSQPSDLRELPVGTSLHWMRKFRYISSSSQEALCLKYLSSLSSISA